MLEERIFTDDLEGAEAYILTIAKEIEKEYSVELGKGKANETAAALLSGMPSMSYEYSDRSGRKHKLSIDVDECFPKPKKGRNYTHFLTTEVWIDEGCFNIEEEQKCCKAVRLREVEKLDAYFSANF
jgi:hypothetical protein